jgi:UPF0755 protein
MKKWLKLFLILILLVGIGLIGMTAYNILKLHEHNYTDESQFIYIRSGTKLNTFFNEMDEHPLIHNGDIFRQTAGFFSFKERNLKPGRYKVPQSYSYFSLFQLLKSGEQTPVNVVLNNERTLEELAEKLARYLEPDQIEFQNYFYQITSLDSIELNPEILMSYIIPNTYQFFWNTSTESFMKRMLQEHRKFWNKEDRQTKAYSLGMTELEVYILASIVERESQVKSERPIIAGLYLNRLKTNMKLQADPTVVFAVGDFSLKRVLYDHLLIDSPYNTYLYEGLPPGPICMASINSIDAVLNAVQHDYVYMCAKPDLSGGHVFSETYAQHLKNAAIYRVWLSKYLREQGKQEINE